MVFSFEKCKGRISLLIEMQNIIVVHATKLETLRNSEIGPKKPAVYTDEIWVRSHC
jgi:hypothetical protein